MQRQKDFSVLKWIVFPSMSITLAAIVAWFNVTVFGWRDGASYIAAVGIIAAFSIIITKYVGSTQSNLAIAAFIFEILLMLALAGNAVYSLSVQRKMSVARQSEASNVEAIREAKQLRSRSAQKEAMQMVHAEKKDAKSSDSIFAENESILLWVMAIEVAAYMLAGFTLLGISHLTAREIREVKREYATEIRELQAEGRLKGDIPVKVPPRPLHRPTALPMVAPQHEGVKGKGNGMDVGK